jgi:hypothetical protein
MKQYLKNTLILIFGLICFQLNAQMKLEIRFNKEAGRYENAIRITMDSEVGSSIHYTTNGSRPNRSSAKFNSPIIINKTMTLQAVAFKGNKSSEIYTKTYLIDENTAFMVVALTVEPDILNNSQTGWLNKGPNADSIYPFLNANYWTRREVSANIEIFETDGTVVFNDKVGLKLFGGMSRTFNQKSFAIATRDIYGANRINYRIFPDKKQKKYKHLVIRNSGSDCEKAHFRDPFMSGLLNDIDIEKQSYRPIIYYVNGRYWGIYYLRDKVNRYFVGYSSASHRDSIDLIEHQERVKVGDIKHYNKMLKYLRRNDLGKKEHYDYINTQMDVDNFLTLQTAQIYFDNQDAGGNIKFWRPRTADGRWRWVLYDTDWGFGLQEKEAYKFNTLQLHTDPNSTVWPNPQWSTFILRNLLENKDFEQAFVNRFADYMNTIFEPNRVESRIDSFRQILLPEIDRHISRWKYNKLMWNRHIERMHLFATERPAYMRKFLQQKFDIGEARNIELTANEGGHIIVNNHTKVTHQLKGKYFEKVPIILKAFPNYGYVFSHWELPDGKKSEEEIIFSLANKINKIKAVFKDSNHPMDGKVVFNEISPNNKESKDWVELFNLSEEPINLKGWIFRDTRHSFNLPNMTIPAEGYLILSADTAAFRTAFPKVKNVVGNFDFGISKKNEMLRIFANNGALIDSVFYDLNDMDSTFTLSLPFPSMENSDEQNWSIITGIGTPNQPNPGYQQKLQSMRQRQIFLIGGGVLAIFGIGFFAFKYFRRKETISE